MEKSKLNYMNSEVEDTSIPDLTTNWNEISGKIKETFPNISDRDFQFMSQGENELIGRLQMKTGKTKAQIRNWVQSSRIM